MRMGTCRGCGALMGWVKTAAGKNMPVDPEPDQVRGNVVISDQDGRARVFGNPAQARAYIAAHGGDGPFVSHFATCPARERFRQPTLGEAA